MDVISAQELEQKINDGEKLNIVDVREDFEVAMGKIPIAKNIPLGQIPNRLNEFDKNEHYYIVCQSGARSANACAYLSQHGYNVTNIAGGMMEWNGDIE